MIAKHSGGTGLLKIGVEVKQHTMHEACVVDGSIQ